MPPKLYLKLCEGCGVRFMNRANRNCPYCDSNRWRYLDSAGAPISGVDPADRMQRIIVGVPIEGGGVFIQTERRPWHDCPRAI